MFGFFDNKMKKKTDTAKEKQIETPKKRITLAKNVSCEMEEKKSIFIGHATPVRNEDEARAFIESKRREYHDATHNCYAYLLNNGAVARYSDDGEPSGTAGVPILNVVKMSGATDLAVVVTRYFGGILLGAGGLVRAYTSAAKIAVDASGLAVFERVQPREDYGDVLRLSKTYRSSRKNRRDGGKLRLRRERYLDFGYRKSQSTRAVRFGVRADIRKRENRRCRM